MASNISPWVWHARSQVGWRLAVASSPKISRPRPPARLFTGVAATLFRKAATSVSDDFLLGSLESLSAIPQPTIYSDVK